jgi:hypothetical protein
MLDDEVQALEVRRGMINVGDIERIAVERNDRRSLVDVDVLDAELFRLLQLSVGPRIGQLVASAVAAPFGGVKFDALDVVFGRHRLQGIQPGLAVARIECAIQDDAVRWPCPLRTPSVSLTTRRLSSFAASWRG